MRILFAVLPPALFLACLVMWQTDAPFKSFGRWATDEARWLAIDQHWAKPVEW